MHESHVVFLFSFLCVYGEVGGGGSQLKQAEQHALFEFIVYKLTNIQMVNEYLTTSFFGHQFQSWNPDTSQWENI